MPEWKSYINIALCRKIISSNLIISRVDGVDRYKPTGKVTIFKKLFPMFHQHFKEGFPVKH